MGLDQDTRLTRRGENRFEGSIVEHWWTPRGPLGGYVMAILLRGMTEAVAAPDRQARSLTVHFLRPPAVGRVEILTQVERVGRSLSSASARLEQDGRPLALAIASFSIPWAGPELTDGDMPEVAPAEALGPGDAAIAHPVAPPFIHHVSMQRRFGDPPFSRSDRAEVGGWLGLLEERPIDPIAVALVADAWVPAPWPRLAKLAPAPTVEMSVYFRAPLPVPSTLLLGRFRTRLVRDGFFEEDGELWLPDGTLIAQSRQLGILIGAE